MLPEPLHPAVVHFPIVLAVLLPLTVVGALIAIRMGSPLRRTWLVPVGMALALTASAWASVETGEAQEDRVERVVPESAIHTHEERAERFLVLSGVLFAVLAGGMLGGTIGSASRMVGSVGAFLFLLPTVQVGASGGELVYEHGAAAAYVTVDPAGDPASDNADGDADQETHDGGQER
jgi:uncharacterized membrane protein